MEAVRIGALPLKTIDLLRLDDLVLIVASSRRRPDFKRPL